MGPLFPMQIVLFIYKCLFISIIFGFIGSCVGGGGLRDVGCSNVRGCDNV